MSSDVKKEIQLEIAYVLFSDIVGYSKVAISEQRALRDTLSQIVRGTQEFQKADAAGRLIKIPTGDGMALVFYSSPAAPVECALEISRALKAHPNLHLRMGVHSGPVSGVIDVNDAPAVAGVGINMAQRVMDCGDAGHILLSKHAADDVQHFGDWHSHLHDLGECEVKHGVRLSVVNFYSEDFGNPAVPEKLKPKPAAKSRHIHLPPIPKWALIGAPILIAGLIALGLLFLRPKPSPPAAPGTIPEKSVAVLPFENLSADKENVFFTDGVQDEILTHLAKIADLKVISRTSVMQYKSGTARNLREIGQALGVAHLLEGSVQRAADRVRVNAQLIDARSDAHLWAQTYDRKLADVFAIQSEIAKTIADQLQARLSRTEKAAIGRAPTSDLAAFDFYTRAKALLVTTSFTALQKDKFLQAVELLDQAVARDPKFLLAHCQLANAHDRLYFLGYDHTPARLALAGAAVEAALRLGRDSGEAHLALAQHLYRGQLDYDHARVEIVHAQRTLPNDPLPFELLGFIDRRQGRWEQSARNLERAIQLDPRNFYTLQQISLSYLSLRRFPEAISVLDRALAIVPKDIDTRVARATVDVDWRADTLPLRATIEAILEDDPAAAPNLADSWLNLALYERDFPTAARALAALTGNNFGADSVGLNHAFGEGLVARIRGDAAAAYAAFSEARVQQERLVAAQPAYGPVLCVLGLIDAGLGRKDDALREGQKAVQLLPIAKDFINGVHMIEYFGVIAAWTGEKDLAFEQLETAVKMPGSLTYGQLKLHPFWDPLRDDPRFDKIVASLAPKQQ
jgi:TolB-like protein/class 3 adenylate cyclase/Tfp pilus assembly protein PilF